MKSPSATFIANEEATQRRPVELYHIYDSNSNHWRYTSGDVSVSYGGNTYTPATIKRSSVKIDDQLNESTLNVQFSQITTPIINYIATYPFDTIWISVNKLHRDQSPLEASVVFIGQIRNVSFRGNIATINCVGFETFLKKPMLRYRYQNGCNNSLYDTRCGVTAASYKTSATVTVSADGLTVSAAAFGGESDGYFTRGKLEYGNEKRLIVGHTGNDLTLRSAMQTLETGHTADAYAGCDLLIETCKNKFNNVVNFFGMPYIPFENPALRW